MYLFPPHAGEPRVQPYNIIHINLYSSALKFILQELTDMALKHYSRIQIFDQDDDPI